MLKNIPVDRSIDCGAGLPEWYNLHHCDVRVLEKWCSWEINCLVTVGHFVFGGWKKNIPIALKRVVCQLRAIRCHSVWFLWFGKWPVFNPKSSKSLAYRVQTFWREREHWDFEQNVKPRDLCVGWEDFEVLVNQCQSSNSPTCLQKNGKHHKLWSIWNRSRLKEAFFARMFLQYRHLSKVSDTLELDVFERMLTYFPKWEHT